jgi:hypothetical protein
MVLSFLMRPRCPHCGAPWNTLREEEQKTCDKCGIPWGTPRSAAIEAEKRAAEGSGQRVADTEADAMHAEAETDAEVDAGSAPSRLDGA